MVLIPMRVSSPARGFAAGPGITNRRIPGVASHASRCSASSAVSALKSWPLLAVLAIGSSPATAQVPNETAVKAYLELLSRYEHGDYESVAREGHRLDAATARALAVRAFDDIEIEMARPQNRDLATQDRLRVERLRRLTLTLLVHTEVAVRLNTPEPLLGQLSLLDDVVDRLGDLERDFRAKGWIDTRDTAPAERRPAGERQWDAVWQLIRQWHLVVISHLQRMGNVELLKRHVDVALQSFRNDPELLLARGTASEMEADAGMIDRSMATFIYTPEFMQQWRDWMSAAGGDYRNVVRRRPDLHEAWLRLGRTRAHLGDRDEARRVLTQVGQKAPVAMRYLAYLFLAELAERQHPCLFCRSLCFARARNWSASTRWSPTMAFPLKD